MKQPLLGLANRWSWRWAAPSKDSVHSQHYVGAGFEVPSTPMALWCWLKGEDQGELVHRVRLTARTASPAFRLEKVIDAFQYGPSLDLAGYEDGTENPKGEKAAEVAVVRGQGEGLDDSSFVAVQQWVHDLDLFESMTPEEQDNMIGRRKSDNAEIEHAPLSAHIKRTAQESFEPEAFILRRSMPWAAKRRLAECLSRLVDRSRRGLGPQSTWRITLSFTERDTK